MIKIESKEGRLVNIVPKELQEVIQKLINIGIKQHKDNGFNENQLSDGYHTFDELYEFRKMYNALLFNTWALLDGDLFDSYDNPIIEKRSTLHHSSAAFNVHKSWKHNDGEQCFGREKEWFIVSAMLPTGLVSNHYKAKDWDLFQVPEVDKAIYECDGHTGKDVLKRMLELIPKE